MLQQPFSHLAAGRISRAENQNTFLHRISPSTFANHSRLDVTAHKRPPGETRSRLSRSLCDLLHLLAQIKNAGTSHLKTVHPEQVRRRDEQFAHPAEPGFTAQRLPLGGGLGKIVGTDMGRHRLIFLGRQRRPQRLVLALPAAKPSVSVFAVWTCVLVDQEESAIADDAADFAHQAQLCRGEKVV